MTDSVTRTPESSAEPGFSWKQFKITCVIILPTSIVLVAILLHYTYCGRPYGAKCRNKLHHISLALHNYHDVFGRFPPAYIADQNGWPMHSWRVLILPYLESQDAQELIEKYRFDEPWNGPNNGKLANLYPDLYRCPTNKISPSATTNYVAVIGIPTVWPETEAVGIPVIKDGTSNTIHVVEVADSGIHWMEPRDFHLYQIPMKINPAHGFGISSHHQAGANVGLCDGSSRFLSNDISPETLRRLLVRNDGEKIDNF